MIWDIVLLSRPVHQYLGMKEPKTKGETVSYYEKAVKKAVVIACVHLLPTPINPLGMQMDACRQATLLLYHYYYHYLLTCPGLILHLWMLPSGLKPLQMWVVLRHPVNHQQQQQSLWGDPPIFIQIVLISFRPLKCIELKNLDPKNKNSSMWDFFSSTTPYTTRSYTIKKKKIKETAQCSVESRQMQYHKCNLHFISLLAN